MSDFLKKFKSVFIIEDEAGATAAASAAPQTTPAAEPMPTNDSSSTTSVPSSGSVNDRFVEILFQAIAQNNQDGFDYFEFKQALKNLSKIPMDEAARYQSAYATAQTMGATPAKLLDSARFYLNVLNGERAKFNEAHAQQRAKLIGNREEEIKTLEQAVQQKSEQISQLTQQIEEHRQKSEQIRREITESTVKIETTKADFEATFALVAGQVQEDAARIQQHLQ